LGDKWPVNLACDSDFHVNRRVILRAANLRHGTNGFTSPPEEGMLWIFTHHVTKHNTPIHNILSTTAELSICQKTLGTLPEDGKVMPKHVAATIHNE
jgi:hypothetical protein